MFFFSSRRRHTRCLSDWSSDVCSSDLDADPTTAQALLADGMLLGGHSYHHDYWRWLRSEERRVGKEWRTRRAAEHLKNKKSRLTSERSDMNWGRNTPNISGRRSTD